MANHMISLITSSTTDPGWVSSSCPTSSIRRVSLVKGRLEVRKQERGRNCDDEKQNMPAVICDTAIP